MTTPAETSPERPLDEAPGAGSLARAAAIRCALFGLAFTLGSFAVLSTDMRLSRELLPGFALTLGLSSVSLAPVTVLELAAKRWPPTFRRDAVVGSLALFVGSATVLAAFFQGVFSYSLLASGSYEIAAEELVREVRRDFELELGAIAFSLGVLTCPLVLGRARNAGLVRVAALSLATVALLSAPALFLFMRHANDRWLFLGFAVTAAVALPVASSVSDRIESWILGQRRGD